MRHQRNRALAAAISMAALVLPLTLVACGGPEPGAESTPSPAKKAKPSPTKQLPKQATEKDFRADNFNTSAVVDNKWLPFKPGMLRIYEGFTTEDGVRTPRRVVRIVTDLTKQLYGVRTTVFWNRDYMDGVLLENEIAFFAQDKEGVVWRFGQYSETYDGKELESIRAWIPGIQDAKPGVYMQAEPAVGAPAYAMGWGPEVGWNDRAKVAKMGERVCVPVGCYDDVLVVEEFELDIPDAFQIKYHAPDVGDIKVGWRGSGEEEQEELDLVEIRDLDTKEMDKVRAEAFALEDRGYKLSKQVYAQTEPAKRR